MDFVRSKTRDPISLGAMLDKANEVRDAFASLFGASSEEVSFLFATSEGENVVARALELGRGDNVVVDDLHYETSYVLYRTLEETKGLEVRIAKSMGGRADAEHFEPLVDDRTRILSVSWVSHQNGFRHDLKSLADLAHRRGALLYADGIQALGMFPVDLHDLGVDFVASGTYKWLLAAYGIAPFYVRREHLERIVPDRFGSLGIRSSLPDFRFEAYETARKYEYATLAFGPMYQLGASLGFLRDVGLERIAEHTLGLADYLRDGLLKLSGSRCVRRRTRALPSSRSTTVPSPKGRRSSSPTKRIRVSFREEGTQIRAGAALFNTKADIDHLLSTMEKLHRA